MTLRRLAVLVALACGAQAQAAARRPNVVICEADDWSHPHAGAYGDRLVATPAFDRVAREGALFTRAFAAAPSCTPSRAALLTGQSPHRLDEGGNLWGSLPARHAVYPDLLEKAGYAAGLSGKGWGPGRFEAGGRARNPAGPPVKSLAAFLDRLEPGRPLAFWCGSSNPHRPYERGAGARAGRSPAAVKVPPAWPDTPEVRGDVLDYYQEVEAFDREAAEVIASWSGGACWTTRCWWSPPTTACRSRAPRRTRTMRGRACRWRCAGLGARVPAWWWTRSST